MNRALTFASDGRGRVMSTSEKLVSDYSQYHWYTRSVLVYETQARSLAKGRPNSQLITSHPCSTISLTTHRPRLPDPPVTTTRGLRSGSGRDASRRRRSERENWGVNDAGADMILEFNGMGVDTTSLGLESLLIYSLSEHVLLSISSRTSTGDPIQPTSSSLHITACCSAPPPTCDGTS